MIQPKTFLYFLLVVFAACSTPVPPNETFVGQGLKVGKVEVMVDANAIAPERLDVLLALDGISTLKTNVTNLLVKQQLFDPNSDIVLAMSIYDFRVRHGATKYFTGFFSGSDAIRANMVLRRGDANFLVKVVEASGGNGIFNISRNSRGTNLLNSAGILAVAALKRERLGQDVAVMAAESAPADKSKVNVVVAEPAIYAARAMPKNEASAVVSPSVAGKTRCGLDQILSMKKMGLTDTQVEAACK